MGVKYNGKCPIDDIYKEKDMFATFCTEKVFEADGDVYLTNDISQVDENNKIYFNYYQKLPMQE